MTACVYYIVMCFASCWTDALLHRVQFILTCCTVMFRTVAAQSYTAAIAALMTSKNIWHNFTIIEYCRSYIGTLFHIPRDLAINCLM